MRRIEFSAKVKVAAFERSGGKCDGCGVRLSPGKMAYDHGIPAMMGGEATLENCVVLCSACHGVKTTARDIPDIAKAKRRQGNFVGARKKRRPMPGSRNSEWKSTFNRGWVRRDDR